MKKILRKKTKYCWELGSNGEKRNHWKPSKIGSQGKNIPHPILDIVNVEKLLVSGMNCRFDMVLNNGER